MTKQPETFSALLCIPITLLCYAVAYYISCSTIKLTFTCAIALLPSLSLNRQPQNKLHSKSVLLCISPFSALGYAAASSPLYLFSTLLCFLLCSTMPFLYIGNNFIHTAACSPLLRLHCCALLCVFFLFTFLEQYIILFL